LKTDPAHILKNQLGHYPMGNPIVAEHCLWIASPENALAGARDDWSIVEKWERSFAK
jgi:hypothetical protein